MGLSKAYDVRQTSLLVTGIASGRSGHSHDLFFLGDAESVGIDDAD